MDSTVRGTRLDRYLEKNLDIWHNSDESGRYPSKGQAANGALDDGAADRPAPFAALPAWPAGMHCSRARAVPCRYEARSSSQRVALSRGTRRASVLPEAARTAGRRPASTTSNPRGRGSPTCRLWRALLCSASSRAVCQNSLPFPAPPSCSLDTQAYPIEGRKRRGKKMKRAHFAVISGGKTESRHPPRPHPCACKKYSSGSGLRTSTRPARALATAAENFANPEPTPERGASLSRSSTSAQSSAQSSRARS